MLSKTEKGYLALTLSFLAAGSGIKAYRRASVRIGPYPDPIFQASAAALSPSDSLAALTRVDSNGAAGPLPGFASASVDSSGTGFGVNDSLSNAAVIASGTGTRQGLHEPPHALSNPGKSAFTGKVSLNRAGSAELTHVKGIGEKTASAILEFRKSHGPFRDMRDLLQVKGIGEKKLEKLRPFLIL